MPSHKHSVLAAKSVVAGSAQVPNSAFFRRRLVWSAGKARSGFYPPALLSEPVREDVMAAAIAVLQ